MKKDFRGYLEKNEKKIGVIASILTIIMFFSLIEVFISNINGDSNIFIQPIATVFAGFFWSLYAYSIKDKFLLIPNILACIFGGITAVSAFV
ncbi:hypothetical protein KAJ41_02445 [Candidatus Parcubacteria bacterium]|nr:hypothetical protein [Candidatus Parcubacteria bacterium]